MKIPPMTPEWLDSKLNDDIEEPGGVMACSPFLYSYMKASVYVDMLDTVKTILDLCLVEYTRDRQHLGVSDDRFIWMMERTMRHARRVIRKTIANDPNYTTENQ